MNFCGYNKLMCTNVLFYSEGVFKKELSTTGSLDYLSNHPFLKIEPTNQIE